MYTIILKDILRDCSFPEAGNKPFAILCKNLAEGQQIIINMEGVSSLPSMFLNISFGQHIEQKGKALLSNVSFQRINQQQPCV